jgi:hypothetical protein
MQYFYSTYIKSAGLTILRVDPGLLTNELQYPKYYIVLEDYIPRT